MTTNKPEPDVSEIIEAVANFVGSQKGGFYG